MSDVPTDVKRDILLRLPPQSLLRFRAVCKSWCRLIDSPTFVRSHAAAQISSPTLLLRNSIGTRLFSLSWDSLNFDNISPTIDVTPVKTLRRVGIPRLPSLPVPACNGLLLISHYDLQKTCVIWNPLTREFHEVPGPETLITPGCNGLGYDSATDDYKVVCIDTIYIGGSRVNQTLVYSLKQESWRIAENCPCDIYWNNSAVYVKGALYWSSWDCIVALDLTAEVYRQVSVPVPPHPSTSMGCLSVHLNVLDGLLAYSQCCSIHDFDIWVMKEDGMWTKLFSWRDFGFPSILSNPQPVAYWERKGQLLFKNDDNFIWCDIVNPSVKMVQLSGLTESWFTSQIWSGSIFRLDDCMELKRLKTKRRKSTNSKLNISVRVSEIQRLSDSSGSQFREEEEEEKEDNWN